MICVDEAGCVGVSELVWGDVQRLSVSAVESGGRGGIVEAVT
jgi:hypothetical protein